MARDTKKKRAELREKILDIAEADIRAKGVASLRARDLATRAGCSVGAIYNVFDDLTGVVLAVNGRTFQRLGETVSRAVEASDGGPTDHLITMGRTYLEFADKDPNLWRALFDIEMTAGSGVPAWYMEELGRLFSIIAAPLAKIFPDAETRQLDLMARTLFSSVHGIVLLGLKRRISGVPVDRIEDMIAFLLTRVTRKE